VSEVWRMRAPRGCVLAHKPVPGHQTARPLVDARAQTRACVKNDAAAQSERQESRAARPRSPLHHSVPCFQPLWSLVAAPLGPLIR
jgi:hypothetical protein